MVDTYTCRICNTDNLFCNEMKWNRFGPDRCKTCWNILQREYRAKNSANHVQYARKSKLKNKYKITENDYEKLFQLQSGGCAICKQPCATHGKTLSIDHDHKTGKIRGLLCINCNSALGLLKEDEDLIWNLLEYLKRNTEVVKEEIFDTVYSKE